jgi:hypothetical protein
VVSEIKRRTQIERVREQGAEGRIFGSKRDEVTGDQKIHNEELHSLYSSSRIIRMISSGRMSLEGRHEASMGEMRTAWTVLVGKSDGKRQLGNLVANGRILSNKEIGCEGTAWIHLA